jgi:acid phosphatase (class A)
MVNNFPTLTPWDEEILKLDGSYPSGHASIGWIWALILKDLFPHRSREILKRGRQFGISRNICNVHWHSDVLAGRICGTAVTAKLYACPDFLQDLSLARKELASVCSV